MFVTLAKTLALYKLPLFWPALGLLLGLVLARADAISLQVCFYSLLVALALLFILPSVLSSKWQKSFLMTFLLGLSYGLVSIVLDVQHVQVDESWLHEKIKIKATVTQVQKHPFYTRLKLQEISRTDGEKLHGLADVYIYRNNQKFRSGMLIQTQVKFHLPRNKLNPAFFDYAQYAFEQHIAVIGSVSGSVKVLSEQNTWLEHSRAKIQSSLTFLDGQTQGVLRALLLADRSGISLHINDAFAASGTSHLLAISGLHVGLVAGWGFMLCWWLLTRREAWIVKLPVRAVSLSGGVLLTIIYATLAGWPIPAQRASLMLLAAVIAWWLRASQIPINTMLAALILIVLFDPASTLSVSLWLSFVATSALLIWASVQEPVSSVWLKAWMWFKGMFWVSVVASLATLPLIGLIFERLPVWSLLANILLVPLYSLWILPLALLGELFVLLGLGKVAELAFTLSAQGIEWGNQILLMIQNLPAGDLWLRGDLPWFYVLLAFLLIFTGFLLHQKKYKISVLVLVLSLTFYPSVMLSQFSISTANLYVWDVGQGASSLLRLPHFNMLIDVPGKAGSKFNGGTIAAENARALGVLHLDAVVLSHAQSDHAGGIARLLASLNGVSELWLADVPSSRSYPAIKDVVDKEKLKVRWLKKGDRIYLDEAKVEVIWPPEAYTPNNGNNASLVLLITLSSGQTLLLPGDMEKSVEKKILADLEPVDVLLIPHHGSKTSSTTALVNRIQPQTAIAQAGYRNFYGFPKAEVVSRYQEVGSQIWNTAEGAVSVSFAGETHTTTQFQLATTSKRGQISSWLLSK